MDRRKSKDGRDRKESSAGKTKPRQPERDDWDHKDLDEEMEEIFHPASDHFEIPDFTGEKPVEARTKLDLKPVDTRSNLDEVDYDLHRRESFQYHQPLRKLYHKHRKSSHRKGGEHRSSVSKSCKELPSSPSQERKEPPEEVPSCDSLEKKSEDSAALVEAPTDLDDKVQFYVGSSSSLENSAVLSSDISLKEKIPLKSVLKESTNFSLSSISPSQVTPIGSRVSQEETTLQNEAIGNKQHKAEKEKAVEVIDSVMHKVKFFFGEESKEDLQKAPSETSETNRFKYPRRQSIRRKHHGFNIDQKCYNTVFEPEEAETLQISDLDYMASHRFDDPKGMRRHKVKDIRAKNGTSAFSIKKEDIGAITFPFSKKTFDHNPHELFVELHELKEHELTDFVEWRQTARWIKYEEDVELGPDKWGKPHVPPLSFHSLLKLRQCLDSGGVLLDIEERDLLSICKRIVDCMVQTDQIDSDQREEVLNCLMLRHRHVNEKMLPALRRNSSGYGNLNLLSHDKNRSPLFLKSFKSKQENEINRPQNDEESSVPSETVILMPPGENSINNIEVVPSSKRKSLAHDKTVEQNIQGIQRRVPENAEGAAVLVGQLDCLHKPATVFVRLAEGKKMPHFLEIPIEVRFLIVLLGPSEPDIDLDYHEIGRGIGALMSNEWRSKTRKNFHTAAYKANNKKDLLRAINSFLDTSTVVPPGKWEKQSLLPIDEIRRKSLVPPKRYKDEPIKEPEKPVYDPLQRKGRIFAGFIQDIVNRYPWYWSDFVDGLNLQCLASVIFIYFASVSGAVAFGGLLADKTGNNIGVSETLIGTSISGILFALLSGQPLIIIGTTAPLVLIDETLYKLEDRFTSPFLVIRIWMGIWIAIFATVVVAAEGSVLVKFFSRFMQEIFATIISLIFIIEALNKLHRIFLENPLLPVYCNETISNTSFFAAASNESYFIMDSSNISTFDEDFTNSSSFPVDSISSPYYNVDQSIPGSPKPNTALFSTILMIGTFYIAYFLRHFRNSKFLGRSARRALGDFGVPIGLFTMVIMDYFVPNTYTEKLSVPEGFNPSTDRSWGLVPYPIAFYEVALAAVGGILVFILLFMETQICELIISKKKVKKGSGFHVDMVVVGVLNLLNGFLGCPWQCAAAVRSITHTSSLIVLSKTHAPGETPRIVEVKEQRLTGLLVSLLIGVSMFMTPLLRQVPQATLFGVFLYMGISALSGIHLYERFLLIFMPTKHYPDFNFVRKVRTSKMHLYTLIQIFCIAILWVIKMYATIAFPFALLSMILVHSQIKRLFTEEEVKALDGEGEGSSDEEDEPDFYEQVVV
ncbi:anion exchange protein 2-like isoform X2 [Argiope bruennichi]|uniref:anion exchange protein 2-like isoform X2 n=1 Tax=Argiope bruennichi TaxID=94029 RepID=UPI0024951828|nr:anion exchange protein 2-like isoform X2 [Argiope bruennichi]